MPPCNRAAMGRCVERCGPSPLPPLHRMCCASAVTVGMCHARPSFGRSPLLLPGCLQHEGPLRALPSCTLAGQHRRQRQQPRTLVLPAFIDIRKLLERICHTCPTHLLDHPCSAFLAPTHHHLASRLPRAAVTATLGSTQPCTLSLACTLSGILPPLLSALFPMHASKCTCNIAATSVQVLGLCRPCAGAGAAL